MDENLQTQPEAARPARKPYDRVAAEEQLLKANEKAREDFANKYEGPSIVVPISLGNRAVARQFKKGFHISQRNWHTATSVPRSALGDSQLADAAEQRMLTRVQEALKWVRGEIQRMTVLANDANVDLKNVAHGRPYQEDVRVIGPVSMQLHMLYRECDKLMDNAFMLHVHSEISTEAINKLSHEVKTRLRKLASAIQSQRVLVLQHVNEKGLARPGFVKVDPTEASDHAINAEAAAENDDEPGTGATAANQPNASPMPQAA